MPALPSVGTAPERNSGPADILVAVPERARLAAVANAARRAGARVGALVSDVDELLPAVRRDAPGVVLLDLEMGGGSLIRELRRQDPQLVILVLLGSQPPPLVCESLASGAAGFTGTDPQAACLASLITLARAGRFAVAPEVLDRVLGAMRDQLREDERRLSLRAASLHEMRAWFEPGALRPVFQPIEDLGERRPLGYLALTRWAGESPAVVGRRFAEAREAGVIVDLEVAAARAALAEVAALPDGNLLFVKASCVTVESGLLGELIGEDTASRVAIELSDHRDIADRGAFFAAVATLRDRGVVFSIDESGAGFGSLDHVLDLAPAFIRLAGGLTRGIDADRTRRALALGVTSFSRNLGAQVIADVIETQEELQALRRLGVRYGLGYYIGRPGPLPERAPEPVVPAPPNPEPGDVRWAAGPPRAFALDRRAQRSLDDAIRAVLRAVSDQLPGCTVYLSCFEDEPATARVVDTGGEPMPGIERGRSIPLADSLEAAVLGGRVPQFCPSEPDCEAARDVGIRTAVCVPFAGSAERPVATLVAVASRPGAIGQPALELLLDAGAALAQVLARDAGPQAERQLGVLREVAWRDPFSGMFNAHRFRELLEAAQRTATTGDGTSVAVFKLSNFQALADRHGAALAELVLKDLARALAAFAQPGDTLARVGRTAFASILVARPTASPDLLLGAVDEHVAGSARDRGTTAEVRTASRPLGGAGSGGEVLDAALAALLDSQAVVA